MGFSNEYPNNTSQKRGKKFTFKAPKFKIEVGTPRTIEDDFISEQNNKPFSENNVKEKIILRYRIKVMQA